MAKEYRITVRGKQREDIDKELFLQALVLLVKDYQAQREEQAKPPRDEEGRS